MSLYPFVWPVELFIFIFTIEVAQSLKLDSFMLLQGLLEIAGSGPMKTLPVTKELAKLVLQGHKTSLITPRDG